MALPMIAGAMMKGLLGGKSKKTGGALVKTKDAKIKQARDNQPKVENKASFVGTSEAMYSKVASQKKISASDFKPESQQVKVETEANQETLKTQLDNLIQNTSKLDEVLKKEYKEELANSRKKKSALSKDKAAKREKKLEKKSGGNLLGSALGKASSFNFMDMIGKFLLNTLLGGLALLTMNNLDQIGGFLNKYGGNLYLIFSGLRLGLVGLKGFLKGTLGLGARLFKTGIKTTGKLILKTAKGLGSLFKFGFTKLGDAIVDFARGAINAIRNLAGKPPLPGRPGRSGGRNSTTPGTRLNQSQRTATSSKAARKRYAQRYGDEAAKRRFKGNVSKPSGQSTRLQGKPNKFLQKLFGNKTAKELKQASPVLKKVSKAAKGVRIPIIGPILVAISSMLSGDPVKQTLFKSVGTGLGEALGTLIPIPVVGTILGGLIGEYGGDLLYTFLEGGGLSGIKSKMAKDWQNTLEQGAKFGDYLKNSFKRYNDSLPKIKLPDIPNWMKRIDFANVLQKLPWGAEMPDPSFFLDFRNIIENGKLMKNALFPPQTQSSSDTSSQGQVEDLGDLSDAPPPPTLPPPGSPVGTTYFTSSGPVGSVSNLNVQGAKTTYYDPALGGINASGAKTAGGLPATSTGEGYRPEVFSAAAFPPLISMLPSNMTQPTQDPNWGGIGKTIKQPFNLKVTNKDGKSAIIRVNDVGPGVAGHADNHMLDLSVAAKNYLGTGGGFTIGPAPAGSSAGPTTNSPTQAQPVTTSGITAAQRQQKLAEQTAATASQMEGDSRYTPPAQPKITTTPQQQAPSVARSASYEQQGTIPVVVPLPSPNQQQAPVMSKSSGISMVGGSTIDMVNSYYKAQLLANLYKQG